MRQSRCLTKILLAAIGLCFSGCYTIMLNNPEYSGICVVSVIDDRPMTGHLSPVERPNAGMTLSPPLSESIMNHLCENNAIRTMDGYLVVTITDLTCSSSSELGDSDWRGHIEAHIAWKANDIEVRGSANERFYALRYSPGCQVVLNKAIADFVRKVESEISANNR